MQHTHFIYYAYWLSVGVNLGTLNYFDFSSATLFYIKYYYSKLYSSP